MLMGGSLVDVGIIQPNPSKLWAYSSYRRISTDKIESEYLSSL
jgi:hypothetical protein